VVLLVLVALVWIAVLVPSIYSKYSARRSGGSIEHFHRQLHLLRRARPNMASPPPLLHVAQPEAASLLVRSDTSVGAGARRTSLKLIDGDDPEAFAHDDEPLDPGEVSFVSSYKEPANYPDAVPSQDESLRFRRDPARIKASRRRRRDTLGVLVLVLFFTGLLGIPHSLHFVWVVTGIAGVALVAFIGLAVYAQLIEEERRRSRGMLRAVQARTEGFVEDRSSAIVRIGLRSSEEDTPISDLPFDADALDDEDFRRVADAS